MSPIYGGEKWYEWISSSLIKWHEKNIILYQLLGLMGDWVLLGIVLILYASIIEPRLWVFFLITKKSFVDCVFVGGSRVETWDLGIVCTIYT